MKAALRHFLVKPLAFVGAVAAAAALVAVTNGQSASAVGAEHQTELAFKAGETIVRCGTPQLLGTFATASYQRLRVLGRERQGWAAVTLTLSLVEGTDSWEVGKLIVPGATTQTLAIDVPGKTLAITATCDSRTGNGFLSVLAYGN